MRSSLRGAAALAAVVTAMMFAVTGAGAQRLSLADVAAKLSGTWVLNRELSTGFRAPGRRGGRTMFASAAAVPQGGGGRGGAGGGASDASDLTPEQRAQQAAMRQLQQIAEEMTIEASADSVTFTDARGERTYAINDKAGKVDIGGALVGVKTKWDKSVLKQEFSNPQAKLVQTWGVAETGHLVLSAKLESMTLMTPEQKAVFDRK